MQKIKKNTSILYFTYLQIAILALFIFVTAFTLSRLSDVQKTLSYLTVDTVPTVINGAKVSQEVEHLVFLTMSLSNATSQPTRRIITQQLDDVFKKLSATARYQEIDTSFLSTQLVVLAKELEELESLVDRRLKIEESLEQNITDFFAYAHELHLLSTKDSEKSQVTEILLLAVHIEQQHRIHQLRDTEQQLKTAFETLERLNLDQDIKERFSTLYTMLIGNTGIINQKIEALRVKGRTIGRGNFVKNLVNDMANNLNLNARSTYRQLQRDAQVTEARISDQTRIALIAGAVTVLLTLCMIYVLHRRIVYRLIRLNNQIDKATNTNIEPIDVEGSDEITKLANTFSVYLRRVKEQEVELVNMSLTDPLTGIPNRRAYDQKIRAEIASASRQNWPMSLLLIDIDFFKKYNDYYGHSEGDTCLISVANSLINNVKRETDLCARYGGEEFVFVLSNTNSEGAKIKAERIRNAIQSLRIEHKENAPYDVVTISIGVATYAFSQEKVKSLDGLIDNADQALYKAKAMGRNRSVHIDD